MSILIIEISTSKISINEELFPDREKDDFIYEHLRHYRSKFDSIVTIEARAYPDSLVVTRRHLYLKIAKDLGHSKIRVVIDRQSSSDCIKKLLENPDVTQLNWRSLMQEEDEPLCYVWLVFFFSRPFNSKEKEAFEENILGFFSQINLPDWADRSPARIKNIKYIHSGYGIEFQAYLPIEDERWYASSRAILINFYLKYVPIISFQGQKFSPNYE